jgi:hypothetical protein
MDSKGRRTIIKALQLRLPECDPKGKDYVNSLISEVEEFGLGSTEFSNPFPIDSSEFQGCLQSVTNLDTLVQGYTSLHITTPIELETLKREMGSWLGTLLPSVEVLYRVSQDYEDWVKKTSRAISVEKVMEDKKCSRTQAEKLVDMDTGYLSELHKMWEYKRQVTYLRGKAKFFTNVWQMVMQSVSSVKQEEKISRYS